MRQGYLINKYICATLLIHHKINRKYLKEYTISDIIYLLELELYFYDV